MKRLLRSLGALLVVLGVGTLAWAGTTWLWQDPFTTVYTTLEQRELGQEYERRLRDFPPATLASAGPDTSAVEDTARRYRKSLKPGEAVGRLRVPRLGLDMIFVTGTEPDPLKKGPGLYRGAYLPGEGELVYIAGHRTTYSAPFAEIDRLRKGDAVFLELPYGTFEYRITGHRIVGARDVEVLRSKGREVVALQACHPRFFADQRYIAYAQPVS